MCVCVLKQNKGGSSGERRKPDRALQREGKRKARRKRGGCKKVKNGREILDSGYCLAL